MWTVAIWLACEGAQPASPDTVASTPEAAAAAPQWAHSGAAFQLTDVIPAKQVIADPAAFVGKTVRVEGRLTEVCQSKGCWAVMADDAGGSVRVMMKNHSFGIDTGSAGKTCQVEGTVLAKAVDPAAEAHYASEGAKAAPSAIGYEFIAFGAAVLN